MTREPVVLRGGRLIGSDHSTDVVFAGPRIVSIAPRVVEPDATVIDVGGALIAPGFVDLQINGGFGHDFTQEPESIWRVGEELRTQGTTAFLPTLVSTDLERVAAAQGVVNTGPPPGYGGAAVWGLHVEGPFLSPARCGAHDPSKLRHPSPDLVRGWSPAAGVAMVTLAPELPGALEVIEALTAQGVVVSLGHSEATYEQALAAFDAGATAVTHLFNAMSGTAHRSPGLATAALADARATVSLIVDDIHLHPGTTLAAWNALGAQRTMLITDAIAAAGAGDGTGNTLGNHAVHVSSDAPRLESGVLAGSLLTIDAAARNLRRAVGASLTEVVTTVTSSPASLLGRSRRIAAGEPADLTVVDEHLAVIGTVVAGHVDDSLREREQ